MRLVPIEFAKPGNCLGKTIFDDDGRVLLREGVVLTETFLIRIRRLQLYSIYIIDEYMDFTAHEVGSIVSLVNQLDIVIENIEYVI